MYRGQRFADEAPSATYLLFWYTLGHSYHTEIYQSELVFGIPINIHGKLEE